MDEFDTKSDDVVRVTIDHSDLIDSLSGYAVTGVSTSGRKGLIIFIPTRSTKELKDLIRAV